MFNIIEKFISIDGEGPTAGELAAFIRFQGCNLRCSWCDTTYSFNKSSISEILSAEEIYDYIKSNGIKNVTLTGGEPLIQKDIELLLDILNDDNLLNVHIETNGSIDISSFKDRYKNIKFILDYKLPSSKMCSEMNTNNLNLVTNDDVYKFVLGSMEDLQMAYDIITRKNLTEKCLIYFSPVFGQIDLQEIVQFIKNKKLNGVKLQLQLHKIIWDKDTRGV